MYRYIIYTYTVHTHTNMFFASELLYNNNNMQQHTDKVRAWVQYLYGHLCVSKMSDVHPVLSSLMPL